MSRSERVSRWVAHACDAQRGACVRYDDQGEVSEAVGHLEDVEGLVGRADWEAAARRIVQKAEAVGEDRTARALRGEGRGGGGG